MQCYTYIIVYLSIDIYDFTIIVILFFLFSTPLIIFVTYVFSFCWYLVAIWSGQFQFVQLCGRFFWEVLGIFRCCSKTTESYWLMLCR